VNVSVRVINNTFLSFRAKSRNLLFGWRQRKSRFLDFAGSSAFADDPAVLEMTTGNCAREMTMEMRSK